MKRVTDWVLGAVVGLGVGLAYGHFQPKQAPSDAPLKGSMALQQQLAPDFSLPRFDRPEALNLAAYKGKVVLLNFFETGCPHCKGEIPDLARIHRALGAEGVEVIGVSLDAMAAEELAVLAKELKIPYPMALGNEEVATRYGGIEGVPTSFLINREGRIVEVFPGAVGFETLEKAVRTAL